MIELDWTTRIEVSLHARKRSRERLGWGDPQDIRAEIRSALLEGRIADRLPGWTRSDGDPGRYHPSFFYAWDRGKRRCWVLGKGGRGLHVRTLYVAFVPEPPPDDDDHRVRNGFVRRFVRR